jgi:hypothetical protein
MFFSTTHHRLPIIDSCFNDSTIQQFSTTDHRFSIIAGRPATVDQRLKTTEAQGKLYYVFNFFNFLDLEMCQFENVFSTTNRRLSKTAARLSPYSINQQRSTIN